jgi:hypothetical protein
MIDLAGLGDYAYQPMSNLSKLQYSLDYFQNDK